MRIPGALIDAAIGLVVAGVVIGALVPVAGTAIGPRVALAGAAALVAAALVIGRAIRRASHRLR